VSFKGSCGQNHGVKADNVKKLAEGIGLAWADFDRRLGAALNDLDNLGSRRGEAGHMAPLTTKATKVTDRVDPMTCAAGCVLDATRQ
jgi:hypothetical protein